MKGKFENFSPEVPAFMWDSVEVELETRRSKRIGVVWLSVATVVLIAVSGVLFFNSPDTVKMNSQKSSSVTNPIKNTDSQQNASDINRGSATENNSYVKGTSDLTSVSALENKSVVSNISKSKSIAALNSKSGLSNAPIAGAENAIPEKTSPEKEITTNTLKNENRLTFGSINQVQTLAYNSNLPEFLAGAELKEMIVGEFLQLTLSIPQPQKPNKRKLSRWAFEVGYDMNQTAMSYSVNPQLGQYVHKNYLKRMHEGEVALVAPQLHTSLRYQLNDRWVLTAGIGFTQNRTSQQFDFQDSVPVSVSQGFEADAYGNYPIFGYVGLGRNVKYDGIQMFNMVSIPVGVVYEYPLSRKLKLTTEANMRYNFVSGTQGATLNYYDLSLQNSQKDLYRNSVISAKFGVGIQKDLDKKRSLGLRFNTQGSLTPLNLENAAVSNKGWSVGLSGYYFWRIF